MMKVSRRQVVAPAVFIFERELAIVPDDGLEAGMVRTALWVFKDYDAPAGVAAHLGIPTRVATMVGAMWLRQRHLGVA